MRQIVAIIPLFVVVSLLVGCSSSRPSLSPVSNQTHLIGEIQESYTVRTGDSLYMIAMEFDLDYLDLARWNGISSPYRIHKGQKLRLHPNSSQSSKPQPVTGDYYIVRPGDTLSVIAERLNIKMANLARWNSLKSPYQIHVGQKLRLRSALSAGQITGVKPKPISKSSKRITAVSRSSAATSMGRPSSGKIIKRYSKERGVTGVEFGGREGDPIVAAGDGKVVYSGTGLVRYGKLLIIKHDNNLLTAYAHNSQLQVREGDVVKIGQQIAAMGKSGTDRVKLHFEVRKNGKPVDPMRYLAKLSGSGR
ncbi:MAG: LysM peptidoglycan-binding domain-containing protein [Gammaproteobacteria bacterium]|uniref:LysM peptidoglycan-binding domain-containing protein n=1 Tax=Candidatus Thiopontia autotrophica TaxID=2841688 RepID=A0A8J6NW72_9GAMM|nr:LysM peptidoglycan-binding domain-containing protein [Candidatus Thiopontia autotrophica]MBL6969130.1 LysM peptidoglycan-binding domain-containing protein [Gammaproteobacteria bacterium]